MILIISSKTNEDICERLVRIAKYELELCKKRCEIIRVPGAFEIPAAISFSLSKDFFGYVVLGCIIKSETSHFDHICSASMSGITEVTLRHNLCVGLGLITSDNYNQAIHRSDINNKKNYASVAVKACIDMIGVKQDFQDMVKSL